MSFDSHSKAARVLLAGALIAVVAFVDWRIDLNIAFGFLYLFPMLLVGTVLRRRDIILVAILCTWLADIFDPFPFQPWVSLPQDILVFTAMAGTGLFAFEITRSRRRELENLRKVETEAAARRAAEEQLEFLIDSSPAAILTMAPGGAILLANSAAHRLFAADPGELPGRNIRRYIAALGRVPSIDDSSQTFRTQMQCRGTREHGEVFPANVFFSTYKTAMGPRLAALVVDASEELRDREEANLEQLMTGSRILVSAVSHEVRNVCGAITVIHENLIRSGALKANKDFEALGALVETLKKIASLELSGGAAAIGSVDLAETLEDLRIVLEPYCEDAGITVEWAVPENLPRVVADRHRLLQVLLNLAKNSQRALADADTKKIEVTASAGPGLVSLRFTDSGPGIRSADKLFQPFQKGAESTGLGLYLSRAFIRSFHGELRHDPAVRGCSFVIDLVVAGSNGTENERKEKHANNTAFIAG